MEPSCILTNSNDYKNSSEEFVIGQTAGQDKKGVMNFLWDYTLGYFTKETTEAKCLKWKIERYEDLISQTQSSVLRYFQTEKLGELSQLLELAEKEEAPVWMRKILPILKFCQKKLRIDEERLNPEYLNEVRQVHQTDLLENLRVAARWAQTATDLEGADHIHALCYRLYTTINLNARCQKIFQDFISFGQLALKKEHQFFSLSTLVQDLDEVHHCIQAAPNEAKAPLIKQWANSLRGHLNGIWGITSFDPNQQSNPLHVFFKKIITIKNKADEKGLIMKMKNIAMGSPTIGFGSAVEINPEFRGFLNHCHKQHLRHVYINHQNFIPHSWLKGDESKRCQALHDLAEKDFLETLFVVTLSQNSSFYHQTKVLIKKEGEEVKDLSDVSTFKKEFLAELYDYPTQETGNFISKILVEQGRLREWSIQAMDLIHQILFDGRDSLEVDQRCIFIRLFYLILVLKILLIVIANSYNLSCKDRIDRAAAADAEIFAYLAILANCLDKPHVISFFMMFIFTRAIIVRKRTIIKTRLERLMQTLKFMLDNQSKLKELHAHVFPGVNVTIDQFDLST